MNQIENIIQTALCTGDNNEIRSQAEARIFQLARDNYTEFFLTLANIIADDNKHPSTRQSTATVFKRLVNQTVFLLLVRTKMASTSGTE